MNIFNEGLNSDLSPLYIKNSQWTFPTINARFLVTDQGLSVVNVEGNTNEKNGHIDGAEFSLSNGFYLIGAYSTMGIGFFFSVSSDHSKIEIGTFPSYDNGQIVREYRVLDNINEGGGFSIDNHFNWDVDHLLQVEGKVEYDGTLNMYICSGNDLLRCVNSGFSLFDGSIVRGRHYGLSEIAERTSLISIPNHTILSSVIGSNNFSITDGGNLQYGVYFVYIRMIDKYKNVTPWLYEIGPITLTDLAFSRYIIGGVWANASSKKIDLMFNVSMAYEEVEIGIVMYSDKGLNTTSLQYQGIMTNKYKIASDVMKISITNLSELVLEDWDVLDVQSKQIEAIPQTIATIDNRLWQANLSRNVMPLEVIRGFCEKIKLRCVVDPKIQAMPTDAIGANNNTLLENKKYKTCRRFEYDEYIVKVGSNESYRRYYYTAQEDINTDDVILDDELLWDAIDNLKTPSTPFNIYLKLNHSNPLENISSYFDVMIDFNFVYISDNSNLSFSKSRQCYKLIISDAVMSSKYDMYITVDHIRTNMDATWQYQTTPLIILVSKFDNEVYYYGNILQINQTLVLRNDESDTDNEAGFPVGYSHENAFTMENPTYVSVSMNLSPSDGDDANDVGAFVSHDSKYFPAIIEYGGWDNIGSKGNAEDYFTLRAYKLSDIPFPVTPIDILWVFEVVVFVSPDEQSREAFDFNGSYNMYPEPYIYNYWKETEMHDYFMKYNRGFDGNNPVKPNIIFASFDEQDSNVGESGNDAFYSDNQHIIDDVGYFGGEIYAFSIVATDTLGNDLGAFAPVGIDHYYANTLDSLKYDAHDFSTWELKVDDNSDYSLPGSLKLFKKNNKGIYRFPSRSNYKLDVVNGTKEIKYDEETYLAIDNATNFNDGLKQITIAKALEKDPFNLTHRIYTGAITDKWENMKQGGHGFVNTLNIFKIAFDFSEAWRWARQQGYESLIRKNIAAFKFLRAERVENLQTQGIIQKPNTITPYPKYYELESLSQSRGSASPGVFTHESYCKLISYNFDFVEMANSFSFKGEYGAFFSGRGQLVNSSIKYHSSLNEYYNQGVLSPASDLYNPQVYGDRTFNAIDGKGVGSFRYGSGGSYGRTLDPRAFVYSGKWSIHKTSYKWDIPDKVVQGEKPAYQQYTTPGLGGVGYINVTDRAKANQENYPHAYYKGVSDLLWGEMSFPATAIGASAVGYNSRFRYPYPDIYFDTMYDSRNSLNWYRDDDMTGLFNRSSQYVGIGVSSHLASRSLLKIPFFKGNMPCMSVGNRQLDKGDDRSTRYYTSRCMYFPYDKTRAFFSVDNVISNMDININNYNFIKPIRKTIYSGASGFSSYGQPLPKRDGVIREDGWKTFFIKPSVSQLRGRTIQTDAKGEDYSTYYGAVSEEYAWSYNIAIPSGSVNDAPNNNTYAGAVGATPSGVLHTIRKYFKIEDPRECCPISDRDIITPHSLGSNADTYKNFPAVASRNINVPNSRVDIMASSSQINSYIAGAFDLYERRNINSVYYGGYFNNKEGKAIAEKVAGQWIGKGEVDMLFLTSETKRDLVGGRYFASNRNLKFVPYVSFSFNTSGKSIPQIGSGYLDYKDYLSEVSNRYIYLTRRDMFTEDPSTNNKWYESDDTNSREFTHDKFRNTFSTLGDDRTEAKYPNQHTDLDIFIDTNYEDLTLCNIYKENPENITDITSFYNVYGAHYYQIGKMSSEDIYSLNDVVLGKGDCFLDRTYFKHTSWMNKPNDAIYVYSDDGTRKGGSKKSNIDNNKGLDSRIGATGSADDKVRPYGVLKGLANLTYAHGVVLGLITENKYNIGLRGDITLTDSATGYFNYYPLSELAEGNSSLTITNVELGKAKNLFFLMPDDASSNVNMIESKVLNFSYNKVLGNVPFFLSDSDISDSKTSSRTRIRWSAKAIEGSYVDGWKNWNYADFIDFPQKFGEIKRLMIFNDTLFSFLNDAYFQHIFLGEQVQVTDEQYLTVGGDRILSDQIGLSEGYGLSHKFGIISTDSGIYAADLNRDLIYHIGAERKINGAMGITAPNNILKAYSVNMWYKAYLGTIRDMLFNDYKKVSDRSSEIPDRPFLGTGITIGYDRKYNELLFSFRYKDNKGKVYGDTLVFSELIQKFTSLYSINPYIFANINDDIYSVNNIRSNTLIRDKASLAYKHNNEWSSKQLFYNEKMPFSISFYVNGITAEANMGMLPKQFEAMSIESQQEPFTSIKYKTKDQDSDTLFIDKDKYWTHPEYLSHHWQVPIRLDNKSIPEGNANYGDDFYYRDSSMVGDWLKVTLEYIPGIQDTIKDIFITTVMTTFSLSRA